MTEYTLISAVGRFVVVEPVEKSTVLKAEQISTVFKILSAGEGCENTSLEPGKLVILEPQTINQSKMGYKDICYVRESDIIAIVG